MGGGQYFIVFLTSDGEGQFIDVWNEVFTHFSISLLFVWGGGIMGV